jgi:hypothetical protein
MSIGGKFYRPPAEGIFEMCKSHFPTTTYFFFFVVHWEEEEAELQQRRK